MSDGSCIGARHQLRLFIFSYISLLLGLECVYIRKGIVLCLMAWSVFGVNLQMPYDLFKWICFFRYQKKKIQIPVYPIQFFKINTLRSDVDQNDSLSDFSKKQVVQCKRVCYTNFLLSIDEKNCKTLNFFIRRTNYPRHRKRKGD